MQSAPHTVPAKPAHPDGRPRLRVVRDASVSPLDFVRTRTPVDVAFGELDWSDSCRAVAKLQDALASAG